MQLKTSPSIMFVDDDIQIIDCYRRFLRSYTSDWNISYHTDSRVALAEMQRCPVDVLVTDVTMPHLSGLELLDQMKLDPAMRAIPVIVMTGQGDHELKRCALDAGATDLMNKPIEFEELLARLRSSLRLKACYNELEKKNAELEERVRSRTRELRQSRVEIVARLAKAAEARDHDTGAHVIRVAHYSRLIAIALGLSDDDVDAIFVASPLHDIGKIAIPDSILLKRDRLTDDERRVMQTHCLVGDHMLGDGCGSLQDERFRRLMTDAEFHNSQTDPVLNTAREIARTHHERWDGKGYPFGLAGKSIPLSGRIVALADVFDALTTSRPYKPAYSLEHSLKIINDEVGKHFDPKVHAAFLRTLPKIELLRSSLADQPSLALVSEHTGHFRETSQVYGMANTGT